MADITKCTGEGCPKKEKCYRHTAVESLRQSYFVKAPVQLKEGGFLYCEYYWPVEKLNG